MIQRSKVNVLRSADLGRALKECENVKAGYTLEQRTWETHGSLPCSSKASNEELSVIGLLICS